MTTFDFIERSHPVLPTVRPAAKHAATEHSSYRALGAAIVAAGFAFSAALYPLPGPSLIAEAPQPGPGSPTRVVLPWPSLSIRFLTELAPDKDIRPLPGSPETRAQVQLFDVLSHGPFVVPGGGSAGTPVQEMPTLWNLIALLEPQFATYSGGGGGGWSAVMPGGSPIMAELVAFLQRTLLQLFGAAAANGQSLLLNVIQLVQVSLPGLLPEGVPTPLNATPSVAVLLDPATAPLSARIPAGFPVMTTQTPPVAPVPEPPRQVAPAPAAVSTPPTVTPSAQPTSDVPVPTAATFSTTPTASAVVQPSVTPPASPTATVDVGPSPTVGFDGEAPGGVSTKTSEEPSVTSSEEQSTVGSKSEPSEDSEDASSKDSGSEPTDHSGNDSAGSSGNGSGGESGGGQGGDSTGDSGD